jgi:hypothetical protein
MTVAIRAGQNCAPNVEPSAGRRARQDTPQRYAGLRAVDFFQAPPRKTTQESVWIAPEIRCELAGKFFCLAN